MNKKYSEEFLAYRAKLIQALVGNVCVITFIKTNGEARDIICTIPEAIIPTQRSKSLDTLSVIDLQRNEWRSFRINNIRAIRELDPNAK